MVPADIISGKDAAERLCADLERRFAKVLSAGIVPTLSALQVGCGPACEIYLHAQSKIALRLGLKFQQLRFEEDKTEQFLENEIKRLNRDNSVHGIILMQPLPAKYSLQRLTMIIDPAKDIEGITPFNLGALLTSDDNGFLPPTVAAAINVLDSLVSDYTGKEVVIIGHSCVIGKPLSMILADRLATVTICHLGTSLSGCLKEHISGADIVVAAAGSPGLVKGEWIKKGAIIIDIGINEIDGVITGDVDFKSARERAAFITPVPGGIGPLTTIMLFKNLLSAVTKRGDRNRLQ